MRKQTALLFFGCLVMLNIFMLYKYIQKSDCYNAMIEKNKEKEIDNIRLRNYLNENILEYNENDSFLSAYIKNDTALKYIIYIPSNACGACISTLFSELKKNNISENDVIMFYAKKDELILREWKSYGFSKAQLNAKFDFSPEFYQGERISFYKNDKGTIKHIYYRPEYNFFLFDFIK